MLGNQLHSLQDYGSNSDPLESVLKRAAEQCAGLPSLPSAMLQRLKPAAWRSCTGCRGSRNARHPRHPRHSRCLKGDVGARARKCENVGDADEVQIVKLKCSQLSEVLASDPKTRKGA